MFGFGLGTVALFVTFGLVAGVPFGFPGTSGSFVVPPALPVLGGEPTVAVVTDLFEIVLAGGIGSFPYARFGAVNLGIVVPLLAGSALGARIGAAATGIVEEEITVYFGALLDGSVAVAARKLGTVYGVDVLGTASTVLVPGSALLVSGAVVYSAVAALREESPAATPAAD